jgi:hypothetical protein
MHEPCQYVLLGKGMRDLKVLLIRRRTHHEAGGEKHHLAACNNSLLIQYFHSIYLPVGFLSHLKDLQRELLLSRAPLLRVCSLWRVYFAKTTAPDDTKQIEILH